MRKSSRKILFHCSGRSSRYSVKRYRKVLLRGRRKKIIPQQRTGLSSGSFGSRYLRFLNPRRNVFSPLPNKSSVIEIDNFSFLDYPEETFENIKKIARSECRFNKIEINYNDGVCLDLAPYLILSLMRRELRQDQVRKGRISAHVSKVIETVGLDENMSIEPADDDDDIIVWPMSFQECSFSDSNVSYIGPSAKYAAEFKDTVNLWLNEVGLELTTSGENSVFKCMAEVLDNALIHSDDGTETSKAWYGGFMSKMLTPRGSPRYVCHFSVVNLGHSIYESLVNCDQESIQQQINSRIADEKRKDRYRFGRKRWNKNLMRMLFSIQDGITSTPIGGTGLMNIIDLVGELGMRPESIAEALKHSLMSRVAIVSGNAYMLVPSLAYGIDEKTEGRYLALNEENDRSLPPDGRLLWQMKSFFPGTILSARFVLSSQNVTKVG